MPLRRLPRGRLTWSVEQGFNRIFRLQRTARRKLHTQHTGARIVGKSLVEQLCNGTRLACLLQLVPAPSCTMRHPHRVRSPTPIARPVGGLHESVNRLVESLAILSRCVVQTPPKQHRRCSSRLPKSLCIFRSQRRTQHLGGAFVACDHRWIGRWRIIIPSDCLRLFPRLLVRQQPADMPCDIATHSQSRRPIAGRKIHNLRDILMKNEVRQRIVRHFIAHLFARRIIRLEREHDNQTRKRSRKKSPIGSCGAISFPFSQRHKGAIEPFPFAKSRQDGRPPRRNLFEHRRRRFFILLHEIEPRDGLLKVAQNSMTHCNADRGSPNVFVSKQLLRNTINIRPFIRMGAQEPAKLDERFLRSPGGVVHFREIRV